MNPTVVSSYFLPPPVDSILDAMLTVSPNRQYRGIFRPTTPDIQKNHYPRNTSCNAEYDSLA